MHLRDGNGGVAWAESCARRNRRRVGDGAVKPCAAFIAQGGRDRKGVVALARVSELVDGRRDGFNPNDSRHDPRDADPRTFLSR